MNILSSRILLAGLLVLGLSALQPRHSFLAAQQSTPQSSQTSLHSLEGVWVGRYRFAGGNGQVQMYINGAGDLFGSFASDDGLRFAQISGKHHGDTFHIIFTPPPGLSEAATSKVIDATVRWENGSKRFIISGGGVAHPYRYTFKRLQQN